MNSTRHNSALDGVRGVAILAVMAFHAIAEIAPGGAFGVDLFFALSGFLITGLLLDELAIQPSNKNRQGSGELERCRVRYHPIRLDRSLPRHERVGWRQSAQHRPPPPTTAKGVTVGDGDGLEGRDQLPAGRPERQTSLR